MSECTVYRSFDLFMEQKGDGVESMGKDVYNNDQKLIKPINNRTFSRPQNRKNRSASRKPRTIVLV